MNEKLRQIYELYRDNGLMGDATFEQFAQASPEQQQAIWQLGVDNGIMGEAGPEDFKSASSKTKVHLTLSNILNKAGELIHPFTIIG